MLLQAPSLLQEFGSSHSWGRWEGEKAQANEAWRDAREVLAAPAPYCKAKRIEDIGPIGNKRRANLGLPGWPRIEGL